MKDNLKGILIVLLISFISWILLIFLPFVSACETYNEFYVGENIDICTGYCKFQNSSDTSQILDCNDDVTCLFTASYPNGTIIVSFGEMSRNGNIFNYTLGNSTTDLNNETGIYWGKFNCFADKGWKPVAFTFIISPAPETGDLPRRGSITGMMYVKENQLEPKVTGIIEDYFNNILNSIKIALAKYWWAFAIIGIFLIGWNAKKRYKKKNKLFKGKMTHEKRG